LAEALAIGQDLQIVPGVAMEQLWEPRVGVPQVGGSALCGSESASDFSRFGGGESSFVVRSESLDDALCSNLLMSHDGEDEGQLAVKPLNVLYPFAINELKFPNWVIKCVERIHSRE
jgi:hypothetical protein